jgi:NitT/TauT family transport system ATP-binding protein
MSAVGNANRLLGVALLCKSWDNARPILGPVHFSVSAGEVVALCGPSGCGKTTLLSIIAGLDRQYEGRLSWAPAARFGIVFQTPRLLPWRTALENVALGLPRDPAKAQALAPGLLAEVGLAEAGALYPSQLSLGMAHRVALARALIGTPDLLLLDEALASLDGETAATIHTCLRDRVVGSGMAVLMVTHDRRDASAMADRLLLLGGKPTSVIDQQRVVRGAVTPPFASRGLSEPTGSCPL